MAAKRKQIKRDPYRLNEPIAPIVGGGRRSSVVVKSGAFASIRDRERLYGVLLQHDPEGPQPHLTARDMSVLRVIATEGPLTNQVPAIRRSAILLLATSPTPENLEVLAELAVTGEDFYVRSHALLALGHTGLKVTAHLLRDALSASESTERQAAEGGLRILAGRAGSGILRILRETERDDSRRAVLDRILGGLNEQRPKRRAPRQTAARKRARTGG
jgi:HEAT repeat protein